MAQKQLTQSTKQRDSNFELLRILAMFLIVLAHMSQHGIWFAPQTKLNFNFVLHESVFQPFGAIGNWLFILVSGYFISEKSFSWKKLFRLWFQVFSISAAIGVVTWFSKIAIVPNWAEDTMEIYTAQGFFVAARQMRLYDLVTSFLPCYRSNNWFSTAYMTFFLLVPILGMTVTRLSQDEHKRLIIVLTVIGMVLTMFPGNHFYIPSQIFVFILGFFIAKYIRLYNPKIFDNTKQNSFIALGLYIIICLWAIFFTVIFQRISISVPENYQSAFKTAFSRTTSFPVMLCALCIFCAFRSLRIPHNRVINLIASTTFGVYLIHENLLINKWWWHAVCKLTTGFHHRICSATCYCARSVRSQSALRWNWCENAA